MKTYITKIVRSGALVEEYKYEKPIGYGMVKSSETGTGFKPRRREGEVRRNDNIARARQNLIRRVMANSNGKNKPLFLSLTYWGMVDDREKVLSDWKKYVRDCRKKYPALKFVYTLELQRRGSWHIHAVVFGVPYYAKVLLRKEWAKNHATMQGTDCTEFKNCNDAVHVARYVAKYIGKDIEGGGKAYSISRGLEVSQFFRKFESVINFLDMYSHLTPSIAFRNMYSTTGGNVCLYTVYELNDS